MAVAQAPANGPAPGGTPVSQTRLTISDGFRDWLVQEHASVVFTTYQTGKVGVIGSAPDGKVFYHEQAYSRAFGLAATERTLWVASLSVVWRLENALSPGELDQDKHDRLYQPRVAYVTGDLDIHEIAVGGDGRLVFCNTKYSCLATLSDTHSFQPLWKPNFISKLLPEDRCHLNGVALVGGVPAYVTVVGRSDVVEGWRVRRSQGGMVIDVRSDAVVAESLSIPHSPRLYDGRILLHESGRGWLVSVDPDTGSKEDIVFCPGFLRGLALHGRFALVTTSTPREGTGFRDLELEDSLKARNEEARCAIHLIDLAKGAISGSVTFNTGIVELFAVELVPGVICPMVEGPTTAQLGSRHAVGPFPPRAQP